MNESKELLNLISEYPELPVVPLVDCDVCGDDYGYYIGEFGHSEVGEYVLFKDRYFTDRDDFEEVYADHICDDYPDMNDEDFFAMIKEQTNGLWTKAILVYIKPFS